jgi:hypothetical protein
VRDKKSYWRAEGYPNSDHYDGVKALDVWQHQALRLHVPRSGLDRGGLHRPHLGPRAGLAPEVQPAYRHKLSNRAAAVRVYRTVCCTFLCPK